MYGVEYRDCTYWHTVPWIKVWAFFNALRNYKQAIHFTAGSGRTFELVPLSILNKKTDMLY